MVADLTEERIRINNVDRRFIGRAAMNAQTASGALIGMNFRYEHRMVTDLTRLAYDHDRLVLFRTVAIADFAAQTLPRQACVVVDRGHTHFCLSNVG